MQVIRRYKLTCLFLLLAFSLLAGVVVVALAAGGNSLKERRVIAPHQAGAARRTYYLLTGIPQHGTELGDPDAPVTLQFFGDLQCRDSRRVMLGALPVLIRRFVRPGKLKIVYRSLETDTENAGGLPEFMDQQGAALAAGRQDKLWNFIDVFYREQGPEFTGYVTEPFLHVIAVQAGLDLVRWQKAREPSWRWESSLEADEALRIAKGVHSTPSFLIGRTGGPPHLLRHFGFEEPAVFEEAIKELL
jgi:protein-disulfide isomerase